MAVGVSAGDEVITPCYTFFATAGAVARLGARPVFVDIRPSTFNLDADEVRAKIGPRTKAIVPVHLFGDCADLDPIIAAAQARGIYVIEEAAQALSATDTRRRAAGTIGDIGCFSFFPSKNLGGFGDGGMAVTTDPQLAETLRCLRVHGSQPKYHHKFVGGNFRLDAIQAAILRVKLKSLPGWTEARRKNAGRYRSLFAEIGLSQVALLPADSPGHAYNQFVVRFSERDRLRTFLRDKGIETEVYYPVPLHRQECFRDLGYSAGDFPYAESAAAASLALPVYPELDEKSQRYVVGTIAEFYRIG